MNPDLQQELDVRKALGQELVTVDELSARIGALGYRFDRTMDCRGVSRYMTGARAGKSYPANNLFLRQIDDGKSAFSCEARRDASFRKLQEMRGEVFAITPTHIVEF